MLTPKQARFVEAFLVSGSGTEAAIRAGYSARTARAIASENLKKPAIAAEVKRRRDKSQKKLDAHVDSIAEQLIRILNADISGIFDANNRIKDVSEWPREVRDIVKSFDVNKRSVQLADGGEEVIKYRAKVSFHDKQRALYLLGKLMGAFGSRGSQAGAGKWPHDAAVESSPRVIVVEKDVRVVS